MGRSTALFFLFFIPNELAQHCSRVLGVKLRIINSLFGLFLKNFVNVINFVGHNLKKTKYIGEKWFLVF